MIGAIALAAALAAPPDTSLAVKSRTYLQNFKDMALSRCIATAYKTSPDATADAQASAGGFFEWTLFDLDRATGRVDALIDRTLAQSYGSFQGPSVRLDLMKCMDMYHGPELARLARAVVEKPNRTWLQDNPQDR